MTVDECGACPERRTGATWFASPYRQRGDRLRRQIELVVASPVVAALLKSLGGAVAVLNDDRQILAVNDGFLALFGSEKPAGILGLRPGEALSCTHARDHDGGCGTGPACAGCGAVLAITASQATEESAENKCVLRVDQDPAGYEYCLLVRSTPLHIEGQRFLLLFMQDITETERRTALERTFLHDLNNTIMGLGCTVELFEPPVDTGNRKVFDRLRRLSANLVREVRLHGALRNRVGEDFPCENRPVSSEQILDEISAIAAGHPAARGKTLLVNGTGEHFWIVTDLPLLMRVLSNMLINAFEATEPAGMVRFVMEYGGAGVMFQTWNRSMIPPQFASRIFQRFFSTKGESGRGLGTYSMKLFGEKYLGGRVTFSSTAAEGTLFTLSLPKERPVVRNRLENGE